MESGFGVLSLKWVICNAAPAAQAQEVSQKRGGHSPMAGRTAESGSFGLDNRILHYECSTG